MYMLGLLMGWMLEHEAVALAACMQGAYLVAASLDWCGYRFGYEHNVVLWPTTFLLFDTSIADMRSPWSLAIGVTFGVLLLVRSPLSPEPHVSKSLGRVSHGSSIIQHPSYHPQSARFVEAVRTNDQN